MKHAGAATLGLLETLLTKLRGLPALKEKKPGIFYVKSKPYLHFHEDPAGIFADVRLGGEEFERFPVNTEREQQSLLQLVAKDQAG
ncbi:hypothetical protein PEC18_07895 [Paucibacter sp. O1-1]|nr:hypothetical protein [Paucibacter sp. O1-1]MDA3825788.1 hypothetical protein [Paucibacter sp. O1-1]